MGAIVQMWGGIIKDSIFPLGGHKKKALVSQGSLYSFKNTCDLKLLIILKFGQSGDLHLNEAVLESPQGYKLKEPIFIYLIIN